MKRVTLTNLDEYFKQLKTDLDALSQNKSEQEIAYYQALITQIDGMQTHLRTTIKPNQASQYIFRFKPIYLPFPLTKEDQDSIYAQEKINLGKGIIDAAMMGLVITQFFLFVAISFMMALHATITLAPAVMVIAVGMCLMAALRINENRKENCRLQNALISQHPRPEWLPSLKMHSSFSREGIAALPEKLLFKPDSPVLQSAQFV